MHACLPSPLVCISIACAQLSVWLSGYAGQCAIILEVICGKCRGQAEKTGASMRTVFPSVGGYITFGQNGNFFLKDNEYSYLLLTLFICECHLTAGTKRDQRYTVLRNMPHPNLRCRAPHRCIALSAPYALALLITQLWPDLRVII